MKQRYLSLMEQSLSAYSDEHILRYFKQVKDEGLTEHGFPRLTANMGILIAHGRRCDLLPIFGEMMEFCCKSIPCVKAANDFSVREIICCLWEIEQSGVIPKEDTTRWRSYLATIEPTRCYNRFATTPEDDVRNWALFTAVSEYFRQSAGLCDSSEFIELQIASQLKFFDENGMYLDKKGTDVHQPIMYDLVSRGLLTLLLHEGYRGRYYEQVDALLRKSALLTLQMQSSNGEMAFGGRSNQFLHNEAWMAAIFEYEARRYAKEENPALATRFKAATARAIAVTEAWLSKKPIRHIKNRFSSETKYGCEGYAYFDKYMITVASNLYGAYLICDDAIPTDLVPDRTPTVFATTEHFHKLFLKSGGYALEFDTNADPEYDASGLGRVHREGAPSAICLSLPCPAEPIYTVDLEDRVPLSFCPAICRDGEWRFANDAMAAYDLLSFSTDDRSAKATIACRFEQGETVCADYTVNDDGVDIEVRGTGKLGYLLGAFCFDGERESVIEVREKTLSISYEDWVCRYTIDGALTDLGKRAANRNGHYHVFLATAETALDIKIEIIKE